MPIYEYRCTSCGKTIEAIQKFSDAPLRRCEHCDGPLEKLVSRTAFHLKGGGWFVNDYGNSKSSSSSDSGGDSAPAKGDSTKKDPGSSSSSSSSGGGCGSGSCGCAS